jgi:hypothetical protein
MQQNADRAQHVVPPFVASDALIVAVCAYQAQSKPSDGYLGCTLFNALFGAEWTEKRDFMLSLRRPHTPTEASD